jgi:hypothetical protein
MKRFGLRILLLAVFAVLVLGLSSCETGGTSTVYVGVHGGYGYGPGWGYGGGYRPVYPVGPVGPYW